MYCLKKFKGGNEKTFPSAFYYFRSKPARGMRMALSLVNRGTEARHRTQPAPGSAPSPVPGRRLKQPFRGSKYVKQSPRRPNARSMATTQSVGFPRGGGRWCLERTSAAASVGGGGCGGAFLAGPMALLPS